MSKPGALALFVAAALCLAPAVGSRAYTINTGFTHGCHEEITMEAWAALRANGAADPASMVTPPAEGNWRDVLAYLSEGIDYAASGDAERFIALSLIAACRYPDNRGESVTNAKSLREIHRDPEGQDHHFLRGADHDFAQGDLDARAAGLAHIEREVRLASDLLRRPPEEQTITTELYVEHYGMVAVKVWGPAFHLGIAAHTVQDSFSHTVRSDDLHTIYHIVNYVDAVTYDYELGRDGLRHSWAMDRCDREAREISVGAVRATADFVALLTCDEEDVDAVWAKFVEDWMGYEPGCDDSNDFCGSKWADVARSDPSMPIWDELGCDCGSTLGDLRSPERSLLARLVAGALDTL